MEIQNLKNFLKENGFEEIRGIETFEISQPLSLGAVGDLPENYKFKNIFTAHTSVSSWGTSCYISIWRGSAVTDWMRDWKNNLLMFRLSDHSTGVYRMVNDNHQQVEDEFAVIEKVKKQFNF